MKIIGTEEHFVTADIQRLWDALDPKDQDPSLKLFPSDGEIANRLLDLSDARVRLMDEIGVDVQVLSMTTSGTQSLEPTAACDCSRRTNDLIARTVSARPDRFQGFATLPTPDPAKAARELERAVDELGLVGAMIFGRTRDRNADRAEFMPIYEAAAALRVPLYLHPQMAQPAVRDAYYSGFSDQVDLVFLTGAIGWHYETGMQLIRLILSGVFDRLPDLQIIIGHWGEVVLFYLDRLELLSPSATGLRLPLKEYFRRNVYVTPSGVFSQQYLRWAIEVIGIDRILFSTDYPYQFAPDGGARAFLQASGLSTGDMEKIAHGNWDRLCAQRRGKAHQACRARTRTDRSCLIASGHGRAGTTTDFTPRGE